MSIIPIVRTSAGLFISNFNAKPAPGTKLENRQVLEIKDNIDLIVLDRTLDELGMKPRQADTHVKQLLKGFIIFNSIRCAKVLKLDKTPPIPIDYCLALYVLAEIFGCRKEQVTMQSSESSKKKNITDWFNPPLLQSVTHGQDKAFETWRMVNRVYYARNEQCYIHDSSWFKSADASPETIAWS